MAGESPAKPLPLQGEVVGFRESRDTEGTLNPLVWTFRLDRHHGGDILPPIPVELRGVSFRGFLNEGDTVVLYDPWQEGTVVRARRVYNKTAGMEVEALDRFSAFDEIIARIFGSNSLLATLLRGGIGLVGILTVLAILIIGTVFCGMAGAFFAF